MLFLRFSGEVKAIFRIAESNVDALLAVDLGPKRPFSVGECALWARVAGPRFAAKVAAVVILVKVPSSCCKAAAAAKGVMAIDCIIKTSHSITKFLESPFTGKHPKPISKGTKAAATEAAVTAKSSQVNTLPKAKSQTRSKQNKDMHKFGSVYSERGVPLPVLTSGGE